MTSLCRHLSAQEIVNWVTTADGCVHTDDTTKLSPTSCEFVYTPPTRRDSTVSSRRRRRCVLGLNHSIARPDFSFCSAVHQREIRWTKIKRVRNSTWLTVRKVVLYNVIRRAQHIHCNKNMCTQMFENYTKITSQFFLVNKQWSNTAGNVIFRPQAKYCTNVSMFAMATMLWPLNRMSQWRRPPSWILMEVNCDGKFVSGTSVWARCRILCNISNSDLQNGGHR